MKGKLGSLCLLSLVTTGGCTYPAFFVDGLEPEYPPARRGLPWPTAFFDEVDSLQPTFSWESFPRPEDQAREGNECKQPYMGSGPAGLVPTLPGAGRALRARS